MNNEAEETTTCKITGFGRTSSRHGKRIKLTFFCLPVLEMGFPPACQSRLGCIPRSPRLLSPPTRCCRGDRNEKSQPCNSPQPSHGKRPWWKSPSHGGGLKSVNQQVRTASSHSLHFNINRRIVIEETCNFPQNLFIPAWSFSNSLSVFQPGLWYCHVLQSKHVFEKSLACLLIQHDLY